VVVFKKKPFFFQDFFNNCASNKKKSTFVLNGKGTFLPLKGNRVRAPNSSRCCNARFVEQRMKVLAPTLNPLLVNTDGKEAKTGTSQKTCHLITIFNAFGEKAISMMMKIILPFVFPLFSKRCWYLVCI